MSKTNGSERDRVLVTGGAGFVGSNLVDRLASEGRRVRILDSLVRPGVEQNERWLNRRHRGRVEMVHADLRDTKAMAEALRGVSSVFHFAAQVAVTTSVEDPHEDFEVNLGGTFQLLDAMRRLPSPPKLVFTSTNKVYGILGDVELSERATRYEPVDGSLREDGISERRPLDFHSPYGCSKGAADQYVLDFARTYGVPATVFRMSCIYGPRQFGTEDQGWVAYFLLRALAGDPITIYGDGKQVRDILFIDDLVDAFLRAEAALPVISGQAFNIGGGPGSTISLLELLDRIEALLGLRPKVSFAGWRTGDQRYYVSNTRRFRTATGWRARVGVEEGLRRLYEWLCAPPERAAALRMEAPAEDSLVAAGWGAEGGLR